LKEKGMSVNLAQLLGDIAERDRRDEQREVSPLKPATDAIILDTTRLDISAVEDQVKRLVRDTGLA
jgi:CMP/dCMP kinase